MKNFLRLLLLIAFGMMVFNATIIDWEAPMQGDSMVAIIGVLAAGSAILLLWILFVSLKISAKQKGKTF